MLTCLFFRQALGSSLTDSSPSLSFSASSTSHLSAPAGSITISLVWLLLLFSSCWNWKGWIFFLLRLSSWQELNVAASAGMLQRFCRDRDHPPTFLLLFSLEWCHSLGKWLSLPRWLFVLCTQSNTDANATQSKVRGQRSTHVSSRRLVAYEVNYLESLAFYVMT